MFFSFLIAATPLLGIETQLRALIDADGRVGEIAYRLASANHSLCPRLEPMSGLTLHDIGQYAGAVRTAARSLLPTDAVTVEAVVPGGPAARAGIMVGDTILTIDALPVALPSIATQASYARTGAVAAALRDALRHGPATLTVGRSGSVRQVQIVPNTGCAMRIQLEPSRQNDAASDGDLITLTTALYAATASDDELGFVLAHELGHNIQDAGVWMTPARGAAASRERERRADVLGVWLMARAGYDPAAAAPFIARMLERRGLSELAGSHPSSAQRVQDLAHEVEVVVRTKRTGLPLIPPGMASAF